MSTATTYTNLAVPLSVNFSQYTDVQRGTIFIWFFTIFVMTIITGIRVISGQIEAGRSVYSDNPNPNPNPNPPANTNPSASLENFSQVIARNQIPT